MRGTAALALLLLLGCARESDPSWVARVDGQPIAAAELRERVERRLSDTPTLSREDALSEELNTLVSERVILNRAGELGVEVSAADVEERIRELHGPGFEDDDPAYREQVLRQMRIDRTAVMDLGEQLVIPDEELLDAFEARRDELRRPERVHLRQILVADRESAERLRQELRKGADFAELAQKNSIAPEAEEGGMLDPFAAGELPEAFDQAFRLRPGEVSSAIESPYGFHIFLLMERLAPHEPELDELRDSLLAELRRERLEDLRGGWLRELRREADIRVNQELLEQMQ